MAGAAAPAAVRMLPAESRKKFPYLKIHKAPMSAVREIGRRTFLWRWGLVKRRGGKSLAKGGTTNRGKSPPKGGTTNRGKSPPKGGTTNRGKGPPKGGTT